MYPLRLGGDVEGKYHNENGENVKVYILKNEALSTPIHGALAIQTTGGQIYTPQTASCGILLCGTAHKKRPIDVVSNTALLGR